MPIITTGSKLKSIVAEKNAFIDNALNELERNYNKIAPIILKRLQTLIQSGNYDYNAILAIFTEAGIDANIGAFVESYAGTIQYTKLMADEMGIGFAMTERGLDLVGRFQQQGLTRLLTSKNVIAQNLTDAALKWEAEGLSLRSIIAEMEKIITDGARRIGTEAVTGIGLFEQAVKADQFRQAGIERFVYVGPLDGKTRDECREVLNNPDNRAKGFTEAEIANLPVGFIDRGGWNCRHEWLPWIEGL